MDHVSDGHTVYQTDFASIGEWVWGSGSGAVGVGQWVWGSGSGGVANRGTPHDMMDVSPHRVKN